MRISVHPGDIGYENSVIREPGWYIDVYFNGRLVTEHMAVVDTDRGYIDVVNSDRETRHMISAHRLFGDVRVEYGSRFNFA